MTDGPFEELPIGDGTTAPLYLLRFDKNGRLRSPQAAADLVAQAATATDVFVFAHGWNTVFKTALKRYRGFARGFIEQRAEFGLPLPPGYAPILVGVIWPSTKFVWPWETGPDIAAADAFAEREHEFMSLILDELDGLGGDPDSFAELVAGREELDDESARAAAELLVPLAAAGGAAGEAGPDRDVGVDDVLEMWRQTLGGTTPDPVSNVDFGSPATDDSAAGGRRSPGRSPTLHGSCSGWRPSGR